VKDIIDSLKRAQEKIESVKKKSQEMVRCLEAGTRLCPACNNIIGRQDLTCGHPQCIKEVEEILKNREKEVKASEEKIEFLEEDMKQLLSLLGVSSINEAEKKLQELRQAADVLSESLEG
jgi:transcription elongation factor GreA-like protein